MYVSFDEDVMYFGGDWVFPLKYKENGWGDERLFVEKESNLIKITWNVFSNGHAARSSDDDEDARRYTIVFKLDKSDCIWRFLSNLKIPPSLQPIKRKPFPAEQTVISAGSFIGLSLGELKNAKFN